MPAYSYHLLDVFTNMPFGGNPLAVFTDATGLTDEQMQNIARELNLSETTFVLPARDSSHHYWVRIFTPLTELSAGGHPTIGTAYALAMEERIRRESTRQRMVFEQATGPVSVQMEAPMLMMQQPLPEMGPIFSQRDAISAMLGVDFDKLDPNLPIQSVSCGVPYLIVPVLDLESMAKIRFRVDIWDRVLRHSPYPHLVPFSGQVMYSGSTVHCRAFAPGLGVLEDAATGTASGPLAAYLVRHGLVQADPLARLVIEQGIEMGRPSYIHVAIERSEGRFRSLRVGGQCVSVGRGEIQIGVDQSVASSKR